MLIFFITCHLLCLALGTSQLYYLLMTCYYPLFTLQQLQLPPQNPFLPSFSSSELQFQLGQQCIQIKHYISRLPLKLRMAAKIYVENIGWGFEESWLCFRGMPWKVSKMIAASAAFWNYKRTRSSGEKLQKVQNPGGLGLEFLVALKGCQQHLTSKLTVS